MMLRSQARLRTGLPRRAYFSTAAKVSDAKATVTTTPPPSKKKKRLVVAVGGNALQRRGDRLTIENMLVCELIAMESDCKLMSGVVEENARTNRFDSNKNQTFFVFSLKIHSFFSPTLDGIFLNLRFIGWSRKQQLKWHQLWRN